MKRTTLVPIARVLAADDQLASWNTRRLREAKLLAAVRRTLPRPVAERVFVVSAEAATLELSTATGAMATVVRQKGPDILAGLRREGWEFSGIRLRVQPRATPPEPPKSVPRQWDSASKVALKGLEARLSPGPLRAALGRFLKGR